GADGRFSAARVDMKQVVDDGVPERVRLHPNDVIYVPRTWIADMDLVVDEYVRGLIPSLPRVGAGYSLSQRTDGHAPHIPRRDDRPAAGDALGTRDLRGADLRLPRLQA